MLIRLLAALGILALATPAPATWSITIADCETGEVAVGTVTCLTSFDLLNIVPVVVVGKGAAAVQASGDFDGQRRPIIFSGFQSNAAPDQIFLQLSAISGHQSRQYGIADTRGRTLTFTGNSTLQWAGGVTGRDGSIVYAIQGNILAGDCVVPAIENALLTNNGDIPAKLLAGMQAARDTGGDGRCSCPGNPTGCGCPPANFSKSGHIGGMIVARIGDVDDNFCNANGCADGDYFMHLNVPFQSNGAPDPVDQLDDLFNTWHSALTGRPDAIQSTVAFTPSAAAGSTSTMLISLRDWQGNPITASISSVAVLHGADSDGLAAIGTPIDRGNGQISVPLTRGRACGTDRFRIVVDDGIRKVTLMPEPTLVHSSADINCDGSVGPADLAALLDQWGPCSAPPPCLADLNDDGVVGPADLAALLDAWTG